MNIDENYDEWIEYYDECVLGIENNSIEDNSIIEESNQKEDNHE